jgi:hypothetical protein
MRAVLASLLLVLFAVSNTACIGRMAVSGAVRKFNLEAVDGQWPHEFLFLALYIIPVYPLAGAVDLIIVNSIEFWTGTNPVDGGARIAKAGDTRHVVAEDGSEAISTLRADGSIDIEVRAADGSVHFMNFVREDGEVVARDPHGRRIARVNSETGRVEPLADAAL